MKDDTVVTTSERETAALGRQFAVRLQPGDWIGLIGPLGAGKSVFVRGVGQGLGVTTPMPSPTYTILNCHNGRMPLYHFDLYRLGSADELDFAGVDSYFEGEGVCLVEWAEKIRERWPASGWIVEIEPQDESTRRIRIGALQSDSSTRA